MKHTKTPGPLSPLPKPRRNPSTLLSELIMHAADSVQKNSGAYLWKGGQSRRPTKVSLGRRLSNSTQLTSSDVFTAILIKLVPRPECGKNIQTTMLANKPKNKKSLHTSGPGNNQTMRTNGRNSNGRREPGTQAGEKAGMNQPVVHPRDGTTNGKDPRWPKVTVPWKKKKKKKLLTAREHEPVASPV